MIMPSFQTAVNLCQAIELTTIFGNRSHGVKLRLSFFGVSHNWGKEGKKKDLSRLCVFVTHKPIITRSVELSITQQSFRWRER